MPTSFEPVLMLDVARDAVVRHIGKLPVGHRLPPLRELARDLGLGQSNLHLAIRQLARDGMVYSRPRLGTFVAKPDQVIPAARHRERRGGALAGRVVHLFHPTHPTTFAVASAVRELLTRHGAVCREFGILSPRHSTEPCDLSVLVNPSVLTDVHTLPSGPKVVASTAWNDRTVREVGFDLVGVDQFSGAAMAGRAMRATGCPQVAFLGRGWPGRGYDGVSQLRLDGFEHGWGEAVPMAHRLDAEGYSLDAGARAFRRWMAMAQRPMGIFAVSDEVALGFFVAALGQGLQPRRDFHLIGFDGLDLGQQAALPLSTIEVPFIAMGQAAGEMAMRRLLEPQRPIQVTYLSCRLIPGATADIGPISPPPASVTD